MAKNDAYKLTLTFTQETGGNVDGRTLVEEYSSDLPVHLLKTQVFTEALTKAVNDATQKLTNMGLQSLGKK